LREGAVIQILDAAQAPERKAKPKKEMMPIVHLWVAEFALLLFVIAKLMFVGMGRNAESAQKLVFIKESWLRAIGKA